MTQRIIARKYGSVRFSIACEDFGFDQEDFDNLMTYGREAIAALKLDGVNLKADFGEDCLIAMLTKKSIEIINGDLNFYLVHSVYRILDAEIENHIQFTNSDIELSED